MQHSELIYVKRVQGKGRGVFARKFIVAGTVIEKVPILMVPAKFVNGGFDHPGLMKFFFIRSRKTLAVALGYGSLYNHSFTPNADYADCSGPWMEFKAIRDIERDEEVTINYNGDPNDRSPMPFDAVD